MNNLRKFFEKRIPTLLGLGFLLAGLVAGLFLLGGNSGSFFPKASPETTPKSIRITNLTDTTFSVSFLTDSEVPGYLKYGVESNKLTTQTPDDREQLTGTTVRSTIHHITVRNLTPGTPYYFVISTAMGLSYSENGKPYTITTGPRLGSPPEALTSYGSVLASSGQPGADSIVYLSMPGGTPVSAMVKSSGSWAIPLSTARANDLKGYIHPLTSTPISVFVQGKNSTQTAHVETTAGDTQPLAAITLGTSTGTSTSTSTITSNDPGSTQTSTNPSSPPANTPAATGSPAPLSPLDVPSGTDSKFSAAQLQAATEGTLNQQGGETSITILTPSTDEVTLQTVRPKISGKGPAKTVINVKIESDPVYQDTVTTSDTGSWSYSPPADLQAGHHTLTVSYVDAAGRTQIEQRTFIVMANGSAVKGTSSNPAFTSSPSGSLTASTSASPKASVTPSPSSSSSAKPRKAIVSTESGTIESGHTENTFMLIGLGIGLVGFGIFLSKKLGNELNY